MEGVIGTEECAQLATCFKSLLMPFWCKADAVVWHGLMYIAILVAFGLGMPYEDD